MASSSSRAMYSFSTYPSMTWESVFTSSVLAPSAFAMLRTSIRPSYSAILFVALNSNLAAYFVQRPDGVTKMVEAPGPRCPKPCLCKVSRFRARAVGLVVPKVSSLP